MSKNLTSDNPYLSEPISPEYVHSIAVSGTPGCPDRCTDAKVLELLMAATAPNTRRAYDSDIAQFLAWGGAIPSTPQVVARYLADHATTLSVATLARRLVAIGQLHTRQGLPNPVAAELVRLTFRGVRRSYGRPQRRVAALSMDDLLAIVASFGQSAKDLRDATILLVGFAGAFRRSELSAIDRKDVDIRADTIAVMVPRSKTDQDGRGRMVAIPRGRDPICPVTALERWFAVSGITAGPVFRPVTKAGRVLQERISAEAIALIVKQRVSAIGRDPSRYSGHSLRAGFVTAAATTGVPPWRIKAQTGHASSAALERYIREGELFAGSAATFK